MDKYLRIVAAIFAAVMAILFVAGCASEQTYKATLVSTVGIWHSDEPQMMAKIEGGRIVILWTLPDYTTGIYWTGSFPKEMSNRGRFTSVAGTAAQQAMKDSLLGSQDTTKEFTFENGAISFSMALMGTVRTVNLMR